MQTTINLQPLFSYSTIPMILLGIAMVILLVPIFWRKKKKDVTKIVIKKVSPPEKLMEIKRKYIEKLDEITQKLMKQKIGVRTAYQELSSLIRMFVYEVTGIRVQNYTLTDIQRIDLPILQELIAEYYVPEFAEQSLGNIENSLEKTRKVIERWK